MNQITLPIKLSQEEINQFCQLHSIRKLSLFGSVLRNDFTRDSAKEALSFVRETLPCKGRASSDFVNNRI
jgi:hypothetical protein